MCDLAYIIQVKCGIIHTANNLDTTEEIGICKTCRANMISIVEIPCDIISY